MFKKLVCQWVKSAGEHCSCSCTTHGMPHTESYLLFTEYSNTRPHYNEGYEQQQTDDIRTRPLAQGTFKCRVML